MSANQSIFEALPGIEVPVADLPRNLAEIWEAPDTAEYASPSEFRASQMNLILHLGRNTSVNEARERFATALRFSQRYPARTLVLCPENRAHDEVLLTSRLFSECYIGTSGRDRSCCEAIVLAYPADGKKSFLEDQVSILLENDLPTYYWIHRFHTIERVTEYSFFLTVARRIVYDSNRESPEISSVQWPRPEAVRDLAEARLLPVRQSIGQFLSGFSPEEIATGLAGIEVTAGESIDAEGRHLLNWMNERLKKCAKVADEPFAIKRESQSVQSPSDLSVRLSYSNDHFFEWHANLDARTAEINADFGHGRFHLPISVQLLSPEAALGEAFFF